MLSFIQIHSLLGNGVGDEGAEAFAAALERNRSLTSLS